MDFRAVPFDPDARGRPELSEPPLLWPELAGSALLGTPLIPFKLFIYISVHVCKCSYIKPDIKENYVYIL